MIVDIIIGILLLILGLYGFQKGFVIGLVNLILAALYLYFSTDILSVSLQTLNNAQLSTDIYSNAWLKYLIIAIVGLIFIMLANIILRKFLKTSILSGLDHLGGAFIHLALGYLLICVFSIVYNSLDPFIEYPEIFKTSFFFSNSFNDYNLLSRWWLNGL